MSMRKPGNCGLGFTLVELLVVITIIGLLIAVLLPSMSRIRVKAKNTQTTAQLNAIEQGLEMYRGENALGGSYPPSCGDVGENLADRRKIANPLEENAEPDTAITGAHLLVNALIGADMLGTPGLRDMDRDGFWADDTHSGDGGAYEVTDDEGVEVQPRYGGTGYVDDKMKEESVTTLGKLEDEGKIFVWTDAVSSTPTRHQLVFVDPWSRPILYYKANPVGRRMVGSSTDPGIYWQDDNGLITGSVNGLTDYDGIDFGAGKVDGYYHRIADAKCPPPKPVIDVDMEADYEHSLALFIFDPAVKARNTPVRKDSYLLITAGADSIYGTDDDVLNWTKKEREQ